MLFCPECGKAVEENASYCPNCGTFLTRQPQPTQSVAPPYVPFVQVPIKKSYKKAVAIALLLVAVTVLLFRTLAPDPSPAQAEVLEHIIIIISFIIGFIVSLVSVHYIPGSWSGRIVWVLGTFGGVSCFAFIFLTWVFKIPIIWSGDGD